MADGMSVKEAKEITRTWNFDECKLDISNLDSSGSKPPIKLKKE